MKASILASAAVLALGLGSAFAATTGTAQRSYQQVAQNAQSSASQTSGRYGQSFQTPAGGPHVGGWEPLPSDSMSGGD